MNTHGRIVSSPKKSQRGVALITAVMIVALTTTMVSGLMVSQNLAVHRATNMRSMDSAWWYLIGLEEWAATILRRDAEDSQYDALDELWAMPIDFLPVDEGALSGRIIDLQGRFNLNTLGLPDSGEYFAQFQRLLQGIPDLRDINPANLAAQIADWIDTDATPRPFGAEDDVYLALQPSRRAANRPMTSLSELRLMPEMTPELYAALEPHITVLPFHLGALPINVNTATGPVLLSLSDKMTMADVEGLLAIREQGAWDTIEKFNTEQLMAARTPKVAIDVNSTLFRAIAAAEIDGVRLEFESVLERGSDGRARVLTHSRAPL